MKTLTTIILHSSFFIFHLAAVAAIPQRWTVETSRVQPAQFEAYHGETIELAATMQTYGKPLAITNDLIGIYWQTNGMGSAYWTAPAEIRYEPSNPPTLQPSNPPTLQPSNLVFSARWTPEMDVGANVYSCFIGSPGEIYRAAFQLRLRPSPGAVPSELPLPVKTLDFAQVQVLNAPYYTRGETDARIGSATNAIRRVDGAARPLPPYLHALDFDDTYPEDAAWYYAQPQPYGSCSARRVGNLLERNYDWKLDEAAEFVVRMSASTTRFASVGVANVGTNLTEAAVTSGKWSRYYKCLPGRVVDGINENGVVCEVNVVDGQPPAPMDGDIHPLAAVRWALDNGSSAGMVASNLAARISFPTGWSQNFHWMIADETSTWIVENGSAHAVTDGVPVMTNFRLYPTRDTSGAGQERYDLLAGGANITNAWFTRAYLRTTDWASDFDTPAEMEAAKVAWETHTGEQLRGKGLWQTVHTSVYDITNRTLRIAVQETDDWYTFACPAVGTDEAKVREIVQPMIEDATNGLLRVETDPTVGLTNGTIHIKGETITPLTEHQSLQPATNYTDSVKEALELEVAGKLDTSGGTITGDLYVTNENTSITVYGLTVTGGISNEGTTYSRSVELQDDGRPNTVYAHDYIENSGKVYLLPYGGDSGDTIALISDISDHNGSSSAHSDIRQSVSAKYSKPSSGIPKTDLASAVQTSLGKADSALQAAHNTSTTAHADIRTAAANAQAHSEATRQIVSTWEGFLDGSNVVFSITNYISGAYSLDHAKLQIKELLPDSNEYRIVYDSRTEITNHTAAAKRELYGVVNSTAAVLRAEIADKGDKAWGRRSSTGQEVPISNTVWVTEQNLRIAGGMEYERVAVGEGAIYVLCSKGQTPYMTGDEGALMLKDDGGTNYFGMVRSDSYTIGCNTDGMRTENHLVYLDYAVTMSDHPCIWYAESLGDDVEWEQLNLPDGSAVPGASHQVVWDESPRLGAQECYINCPEAKGFFRATIEVAGDARFRTNMPAEIPSFFCADDPTKKVKIIWNNGNPKFVEAN